MNRKTTQSATGRLDSHAVVPSARALYVDRSEYRSLPG